jgi:hypothetical protein
VSRASFKSPILKALEDMEQVRFCKARLCFTCQIMTGGASCADPLLSEILDLTVLVPNDDRVPRIDDRYVESAVVFKLK